MLFTALLLVILPMRDLWTPDEPDFAQSVREMIERRAWLHPYLNGQIYDEKPILFYWLGKSATLAGEAFTGGSGFNHHVAAWALRLPSILAAVAFAFGYQAWSARFLDRRRADVASLILGSSPLWVWQSQAIQIDVLFSTLLAGAWMSWLASYQLGCSPPEPGALREARRWRDWAWILLGLATLAKGPLGIVLSVLVVGGFLALQRPIRFGPALHTARGLLLLALVVVPWYLMAGLEGGRDYLHRLLIHQNLTRAVQAWDHVQPWWKYGQYLLGDGWPWILLAPAAVVSLGIGRATPSIRFFGLAVLLPLLFLSALDSKQGKYALVVHPFLALLLAEWLAGQEEGGRSSGRRWVDRLLAVGLGLPGMVVMAAAIQPAWFGRLAAELGPFRGVLVAAGLALLGGAGQILRSSSGQPIRSVRAAALSMMACYLVVGTWGFTRLDPLKNFRGWSARVQPLVEGRRVYFWQTVRSGAMVYTTVQMPEIREAKELLWKVGVEERLVARRREWEQDAWGMTPEIRAAFTPALSMQVGGEDYLLLRRMEQRPRTAP